MAFPDQIAEGGIFVIPALSSPNYVAGTSGWTIKSDGTTEFNNSAFRGSLDVGGPTPPNGSAHVGDLSAFNYTSFYGIGADDNAGQSEVLLGAGSYAVLALGAPTPFSSYFGEIKGEYRANGHASTTIIGPPEQGVPAGFAAATMWFEGNNVAEPSTFDTDLYTSAFHVLSNNMDVNGRGVLRDGDSTSERQIAFKSGSAVTGVSAAGVATVNPGFTTLIMFVCWNGDGSGGAAASYTLANNRTGWPVSGNSVDIIVRISNTAAAKTSGLVRLDWIAIGIL